MGRFPRGIRQRALGIHWLFVDFVRGFVSESSLGRSTSVNFRSTLSSILPGIPRRQAKTIGIAVDHRRRNHCDESLNLNVSRLEKYKSKLMIMPRKAKAKKGDTPRAEVEVRQLFVHREFEDTRRV